MLQHAYLGPDLKPFEVNGNLAIVVTVFWIELLQFQAELELLFLSLRPQILSVKNVYAGLNS